MNTHMFRAAAVLAASALATLGALVIPQPAPAQAIDCQPTGTEITDAVDDVTVNTEKVLANDRIEWGLSFSVKGPISAGDFFTFQLPTEYFLGGQFATVPFPIVNEADVTFGCAWQSSEGVVTAVFHSEAANIADAKGTIELTSQVRDVRLSEPVDIPVRINDTKSITVTVHPGATPPPEEIYRKEGWFTRPVDHASFNLQRGLTWRIWSPTVGRDVRDMVLEDRSYDPNWRFNCAWINDHVEVDVFSRRGGHSEAEVQAVKNSLNISCEPEHFRVTAPVLPAGMQVRVSQVVAEITGQLNETQFVNTAEFSGTGFDLIYSNTHMVSTGGSGSIRHNPYLPPAQPPTDPQPEPTPEPVPTPDPQPTPDPVPVAPTPTPSVETPVAASPKQLAATGSAQHLTLAAGATLAALAGAALSGAALFTRRGGRSETA